MARKDSQQRDKRSYRGTVQADIAARTRQLILNAALALASEEWLDRITLDQIAARAGVTVQTIIRYFGTKEGVFTAAAESASRDAQRWRDETPAGDIVRAVQSAQQHYEQAGDRLLRLLAQEERYPGLRRFTDLGRVAYRTWIARIFDSALARRREAERERLQAELIAVTDITMWKLLRRDLGLDRQQTELAMREMIEALVSQDTSAHNG